MLPQLGLLYLDSTAFHDKIVFLKTNLAIELSWKKMTENKKKEYVQEEEH